MNQITPEKALEGILPLLNRAPLSPLEALGAQQCLAALDAALKELAKLKQASNEHAT